MIRINTFHVLALAASLFAVGCTQSTQTGDVAQQDDDLNGAHLVNVYGSTENGTANGTGIGDVPATAAHPTSRLGPHPDPWTGDPNGPHPDPWSGRGGDGNPSPAPNPGDPTNPTNPQK